jgi:hypothetical protein
MLISSCWQSGLDYSEYTSDLVEIFLRGDYVTALECLTVLEESVHDMSMSERQEIVNLIEAYPLPPADEKKGLRHELISLFKKAY